MLKWIFVIVIGVALGWRVGLFVWVVFVIGFAKFNNSTTFFPGNGLYTYIVKRCISKAWWRSSKATSAARFNIGNVLLFIAGRGVKFLLRFISTCKVCACWNFVFRNTIN